MNMSLESSISIAAYLALFGGVGFAFVFVNLLIGRFVRPSNPHPEKQEIYECGEPAIGSSFVQFDLRFYVVALVFIIFDVEVAFLFPWATVFGKANNLSALLNQPGQAVEESASGLTLTDTAAGLYRELGVNDPSAALPTDVSSASQAVTEMSARINELNGLALAAVMFFFVVLLIGFAYEWKTGALDWVHALARERGLSAVTVPPPTSSPASAEQDILSSSV